jgi:hypothetical protein
MLSSKSRARAGLSRHRDILPHRGIDTPRRAADTQAVATTIELDDRRRAPLAKIARGEDQTFLAEAMPDGRIILTPAVTVSKSQATLNSRPDILDAIDRSYAGHNAPGVLPKRREATTVRRSGA